MLLCRGPAVLSVLPPDFCPLATVLRREVIVRHISPALPVGLSHRIHLKSDRSLREQSAPYRRASVHGNQGPKKLRPRSSAPCVKS